MIKRFADILKERKTIRVSMLSKIHFCQINMHAFNVKTRINTWILVIPMIELIITLDICIYLLDIQYLKLQYQNIIKSPINY